MNKEIQIRKVKNKKEIFEISNICKLAWKKIYKVRKETMGIGLFKQMHGNGEEDKSKNLFDWCNKNISQVRVAVLEEKIVGFITWDLYNEKVAELSNNAVHPDYLRKGIAKKMYSYFEKEMKNIGIEYLFVFTGLDEAHQPAREAYKKIGFEKPVELVRYFKKIKD